VVDSSSWSGLCERLFAQTRFGIDLGLDRIRRALEDEGHPEARSPNITLAGTNGKGGTAAFLSAILHAHGRRPGLYTSPHIVDLRERFRVGGRPLDVDTVEPVATRVLETYGESGSGSVRLTFFELTTLMAALLFRDADTDVDIFEVGLGGRLDAVNGLEPDVSVVTTIGLDHTEYLGDTIEEVAAEKAGIFRPDVPAVVGQQTHPEALDVLQESGPSNMRIFGRDFGISHTTSTAEREADRTAEDASATYWTDAGQLRLDDLHPAGPHPTRLANMATALEASRVFLGDDWNPEDARRGVHRTVWPGRLDTRIIPSGQWGLDREVELLIDAAHNPAAVDALFDWLNDGPTPAFDGAFVSGLEDKALDEMFAPLRDWDGPIWSCQIDSPRAADATHLRSVLPKGRLRGVANSCAEGLEEMCRRVAQETEAGRRPRVLVYGSIYLIGEVFEALGIGPDDLATETDDRRVEPAP